MGQKVVLPIHGRQHCPGGADPIPCFALIDQLTQFQEWPISFLATFGSSNDSNVVLNADVDCLPYGSVLNAIDPSVAPVSSPAVVFPDDFNTYFVARFTLGPVGSTWVICIRYASGPGYGRLKAFIASAKEVATGSSLRDPRGSLQDSYDGLTWLNMSRGSNYLLETYAAAPAKNDMRIFAGGIRLMGEPGAPATTMSSPTALTFPTGIGGHGGPIDGGPGVYYMAVGVFDKDGASAGYDLGVQQIALARWSELGGLS